MAAMNDGKGVIFDMDGVLVDSAPAHKQSWFELASRERFPISEEIFYGTFGMQNQQILPILAGHELPAEQIEALADWKEQRYRDIIAESLELAAGGYELLGQLKDNGFRLAIGSSAPKENLDLIVEKLGLAKYFDAYVSSVDAPRGKPAPDTFLAAAKKLRLEPRRCVVVEDAVHGIKAGKAAGMAVIALTTTAQRKFLGEADLIVDGLGNLTSADFIRLLEKRHY
jgi:beta-phosphoglucomutase